MIKLEDLMFTLDQIMPFNLSEDWDNSGLILRGKESIKRIGISLEMEEVPAESLNIDCLIVHHPPFFKSESEMSSVQGKVFRELIDSKTSLIVCHTNADLAKNSFVDYAVKMLGFKPKKPVVPAYEKKYRIVSYVVKEEAEKILKFIRDRKYSKIGLYYGCAFVSHGKGFFCASPGSNPALGMPRECSEIEEARVEFEVSENEKDIAVSELAEIHPYEEPVIEVYEVTRFIRGGGVGRVFQAKITVRELVNRLEKAGMKPIDFLEHKKEAGKVIIIPGSGRSFVDNVIKLCADTFIAGDLGYHQKKYLSQEGLNIIEVSHYDLEQPFVFWLENMLEKTGLDIEIIKFGRKNGSN